MEFLVLGFGAGLTALLLNWESVVSKAKQRLFLRSNKQRILGFFNIYYIREGGDLNFDLEEATHFLHLSSEESNLLSLVFEEVKQEFVSELERFNS